MDDPLTAIRQAISRPGRETSDYDLNPGTVLPEGRVLKPAAVLVPLITGAGGARVILTKRSSRLKHHPGQIAFPGGKIDDTDAGPIDAALREAEEEIGLPRRDVEILGTWGAHETVTGFMVTPVFGQIRDGFAPVPEEGEVEEVFSVPLSHVTDPAHFCIEGRIWREVRRRYYVVPYGPYYIWGATARILRALADRMAE
ncbi:CoA pyrophosphatase [Defluviimonas sp. WL0050]|uniref:CoA pyrophosphatase n=1 Tax=Albidovulum litorale TaxID=2984134 RepID=A0ABT2ZNG0_9RHOB|nr:CoA pyrophosphatase [Defluviimonas sp. WL0050]MCV2872530.1 CoA pyrophosphatase [Defluviimonas sp. WL0050]